MTEKLSERMRRAVVNWETLQWYENPDKKQVPLWADEVAALEQQVERLDKAKRSGERLGIAVRRSEAYHHVRDLYKTEISLAQLSRDLALLAPAVIPGISGAVTVRDEIEALASQEEEA